MLACLVDASTGMVLASRKDQDDIGLPTAAAGVTDITNVLFQLTGELPVDGLEDVMVTFRRQLYVIRLVNPEPQILLRGHTPRRRPARPRGPATRQAAQFPVALSYRCGSLAGGVRPQTGRRGPPRGPPPAASGGKHR